MDGFRNDYISAYGLPSLTRLAQEGARAQAMLPGFPSRTFPCHYTLVTGWHPADHGIVGNVVEGEEPGQQLTMNSAGSVTWWSWRGEPIWVTAEKAGLPTATMFWPASTAQIDGYRPTYALPYQRAFPYEQRIDQVLEWLDLPPGRRPFFISLYFEAADPPGHATGPWSEATRAAVEKVDTMIERLVRGLKERGLYDAVNLIVTSDHGMAETNAFHRTVYVNDTVEPSRIEISGSGPYMLAKARPGDDSKVLAELEKVPHARAYRLPDAPPHLHFQRTPGGFTLLLLADDGWTLRTARNAVPPHLMGARGQQTRGAHGYDSAYPSMKVPFIARGPAFAPGAHMPEFESVHVYSLLAHLLGLSPARNSGRLDVFTPILAN